MSDFEYTELECPNCQGPLKGHPGANVVECPYCGTQVHITRKASHSDGAIVVRDGSGRALLHMTVPFDWDVSGAVLDTSAASGEWPWQIYAEITDNKGAFIRYQSPTEFVVRGPAMQQALAMYGGGAVAAGEPRSVPFEVPAMFFQNQVSQQLGSYANGASYMGQIDLPLPGQIDVEAYERSYAQQRSQELMMIAQKANGMQVNVEDVYARPICRLFSFSRDGQDYRIAIYANITGEKMSYPALASMGMSGLLGGFSLIGNAIGGLFGGIQQQMQQPANQGGGVMNTMLDKGLIGGMVGNRMKEQRAQQGFNMPEQQMGGNAPQGYGGAPLMPSQMPAGFAPPGMADDARANQFSQQGNADLAWQIRDYFVLICPAERFDELYKGIFTEVVGNTKIDDFLMQQKERGNMNDQQMMQMSVQQFQAQNQQIVNQSMEYSRQMNAASAAQMDSWQRQSDAHHKAVMDRGHAMFDGNSSGGSMSNTDKFSEYIRGENTYVDQYGDEHTVSNRWDEAYRDGAGNIIGTEKGVDPGFGWTKLNKKQ